MIKAAGVTVTAKWFILQWRRSSVWNSEQYISVKTAKPPVSDGELAQAVFYTPQSNMPSAAEKSIIIIGDGAVFLILLYPKCVSHRMAKTKMDLGSGTSVE